MFTDFYLHFLIVIIMVCLENNELPLLVDDKLDAPLSILDMWQICITWPKPCSHVILQVIWILFFKLHNLYIQDQGNQAWLYLLQWTIITTKTDKYKKKWNYMHRQKKSTIIRLSNLNMVVNEILYTGIYRCIQMYGVCVCVCV